MKKGEIWLTQYPFKEGKEQSGKRPSIIIADTNANVAIVIPLTTNLSSLENLSNTILINRSDYNNLDFDSVALIFQIQVIDKNKLISKIGNIDIHYLDQINKNLKSLLQL